jgi:hypothetical protein
MINITYSFAFFAKFVNGVVKRVSSNSDFKTKISAIRMAHAKEVKSKREKGKMSN